MKFHDVPEDSLPPAQAFMEQLPMILSLTDPTLMTAEERLDEVTTLLAIGIARLFRKTAEKSERTENSLDVSTRKSAHVIEKP